MPASSSEFVKSPPGVTSTLGDSGVVKSLVPSSVEICPDTWLSEMRTG